MPSSSVLLAKLPNQRVVGGGTSHVRDDLTSNHPNVYEFHSTGFRICRAPEDPDSVKREEGSMSTNLTKLNTSDAVKSPGFIVGARENAADLSDDDSGDDAHEPQDSIRTDPQRYE